jgi:hypothetical protein
MFHPMLFDVALNDLRCFTIVLVIIFVFLQLLLTCCDICILIFHCDLTNVANVVFRCYRHVMLGVVSRARKEGP